MSTYVGQTPSFTFDPRIPKFFEKFYEISDNPEAHEEYAHSFTQDAHFIMGLKSADGYDDILALRKGLWSGPVKKRLHHLHKIFPFGENSNELMLYGTVDYVLKNDKKLTVDWSARALMKDGPGQKLQMAFYQVYVDSTPVANAMKD